MAFLSPVQLRRLALRPTRIGTICNCITTDSYYWFRVLARFWYDLARPGPGRLRSGLTATWARPRPDFIWSARAAAFTRCDLGGDHAPGDRLAASQLPEPRRGPDNDAEPAAADIPAVDADVDSGELIAAQLPQVLEMHDASHRSKVRSCSREPPRSNQYLGRGQDAHHDSMSTYGAR